MVRNCVLSHMGHTHTHTFITAQIFVANLSLSLFSGGKDSILLVH